MHGRKRFLVLGAVAMLGAGGLLGYLLNQTSAHPNMPTSVQLDGRSGGVPQFSADVQAELEVCFRCHGDGGVSERPGYPTIGGQKFEYILSQMQVFRHTGDELARDVVFRNEVGDHFDALRNRLPQRSNLAMNKMAKSVPNALLVSVVQAMSSLPCDGGTTNAHVGERPPLPTKANRCVVCHGSDGISKEPSIPNLAGQQQVYLRRELQMIRDSALGLPPQEGVPMRSHPTMAAQAEHLADTDIEEITGYFSALNCRGGG